MTTRPCLRISMGIVWVTRSLQQHSANFRYDRRRHTRGKEHAWGRRTRSENKSGLLAVRGSLAYIVLDTTPEVIVNVPLLMPRLFCSAFELAGAIHDGEVLVDTRRVSKIRGMLIAFYGADPGPYEVALAAVATDVFSDENTRACFLERVDAFDRLLANRGLIDAWGTHGWVRRNPTDQDRFGPALFVVEAAAICPLNTDRRAFDLRDFHAAAYKRAAARGVEFW